MIFIEALSTEQKIQNEEERISIHFPICIRHAHFSAHTFAEATKDSISNALVFDRESNNDLCTVATL